MADVLKDNVSEVVANVTSKVPASSEGMVVAYGFLVIMALLPIFVGSFRSVKHMNNKEEEADNKKREMSNKDAAIFPLVASATLFGLYIVFQIFSKEYINLLLTFYFFSLGVTSLCHLISPFFSKLIPYIPKIPYHFHFTQGGPKGTEVLADQHFSSHDVICFFCCAVFGGWYLLKKHWIANNIFAVAFATNGVELLQLNNVVTGCILLCGLFVYDIFWVFGTNVMVTVAKSFEAPIKLVFPQDLLEKGLGASNFAMLGLGDIVIPGVFIALLLRFDNSLKRNCKTYFYSTLLAYTSGLMATIFIVHVSKRAQPALLYLVPACLGTPILLAVLKGDLKDMLKYEDNPSSGKEEKKETNKKKN